MGRPSWRLFFVVFTILTLGILFGYKLARSSGSELISDSSPRHPSLVDKQQPGSLRAMNSDSEPGDTANNGSTRCTRLWEKGTSAWFDGKFKEDLRPVWMKENMELTEEIERWWMTLQSNKDKDYVSELKKAFEVVPNPDRFLIRNRSSCLRCAVVGNSGNLKGSEYGELIDSHDVVIRINEAMTKGFEADVGKKETHRLMYPESFRDIPKETTFVLLNFKTLDVTWLRSALTTGEIKKTYTAVRPRINVPPSKILFYNPALMWHIHHDWIDRKGRYPSSGALAVFFAIQFCDKVSVFGMGANSNGYWDHYWQVDNGARNSAFLKTHVHDSEHEMEIFKRLGEENIVTFYKGVR